MTDVTTLSCRDSGTIANLTDRRQQENAVIAEAMNILRRRTYRASYERCDCPAVVRQHLMLAYGEAEREHFGVIWLDVKNRIIKRDVLFTGTLTHVSVSPREVVKAGLQLNAASCIVFHNHPSGVTEPSEADRMVTKSLSDALHLVEMRILDHIIVAGAESYSFAEHGLI